ncbi:UNVERIFIED_ORG: hypothetical protein ABIB19_003980, partial [Arthrobacter sp. UYEF10]
YGEDEELDGEKILVRTDSAGASRKFLWYLHSRGVQFSVSYPVPVGKAHMIDWINDKKYCQAPGLVEGLLDPFHRFDGGQI